MCFLFDFDIKDFLNVIGVVASLVCAFYAFKTFEQAEKIAKIQNQKEEDKEAAFRLNEIRNALLSLVYNMAYRNNQKITELKEEINNILEDKEEIKTELDKCKDDFFKKRNFKREYDDKEELLKKITSQRKQLLEELSPEPKNVKALFFKACKECEEYHLNNLERDLKRDELALIEFLIKREHFYLHISSEKDLNQILKNSEQNSILPEYISRHNVDREVIKKEVIEELYYKMFPGLCQLKN